MALSPRSDPKAILEVGVSAIGPVEGWVTLKPAQKPLDFVLKIKYDQAAGRGYQQTAVIDSTCGRNHI